MAESILKLRVESSEYDQKIKRAAEGLQAYAEGCRKAGGTLTQLDDGVLEFTKALGQMETVSRSAKGSVSELTKTFTDMSVVYNKLTDEEKRSPFGKALAESLEQLKGRIQSGNAELKNIGDSLNNTGGIIGQLKDKFTINIDAITLFNKGLELSKAALDVAKDAFFSSETNVDDWGRTIAAAEGVYDSFLQSLNTGDFSGFIGHINEIINKAHDAYNALDELNTRMTIINPERTRLQARATELKAIIRRQGAGSEAGIAAQNELRQLEGMLTQAFKTESQLNMNAFKAQVDAKLQNAGIKLSQKDYDFLMRTFSSDASYMAMKRGAKGGTGRTYEIGGSYSEGSTSAYDNRNINQRLLDLFTDEWRREYSPLLNAAFSARGGAASTMLSDSRYLKGGSGSGGSGGGKTFNISKIAFNPGEVLKPSDFIETPSVWADYADAIKGTFDTINDSMSNLTEWTADFDPYTEKMEEMTKAAEQQQMAFSMAGQAATNFGAALAGLDDPAAKAAGTVISAIANIALGFGQAVASAGKMGPWAWLAYVAAGTAALATTISTVHSLTGYAEGGMIKGNSYSGDNLMAMGPDGLVGLNAGEIVLNAAQSANVARGLQGGGLSGMSLKTKVRGTELLVWLDNSLAQSGRGELVTWGQ